MSENFLSRVLSITGVDLRFRFRRTAAVVTFLIAAMIVYLIIPDVRTGKTLMQIGGRRVLYNSPTIALGTALLCSLLLSIFGFYLAGNSVRRDVSSRVGFIIAGTPVRNSEYITGKFIGGSVYLLAVMLTCMLSAMVMFFFRGEGSLDPLAFLSIYLMASIPMVVFCAAVTLAFESVRALSGRFGDGLYFLLWGFVLALPATMIENNSGTPWFRIFDVLGIVPVIELIREKFHTSSFSIGYTGFKANVQPILFDGIDWSWKLVLNRAVSLIIPLVVVALTPLWFHRFDPTRIKLTVRHSKKGVQALVYRMAKPVTQLVAFLFTIGSSGGAPWSRIIRAEVVTTFVLSPLATLASVVFVVLSLILPAETIREGIVPAIVAILIITLSEMTTRDTSARTLGILFTAPSLQKKYLALKFLAAWMFALCFTAIPILRLLPLSLSSAGSLFIGSGFLAASAVGLGLMSGSRKTFIAVFLMLLYIALNAKDIPVLDFAGFLGCATVGVQAGYILLATLVLSAAQIMYTAKIRRM